MFISLIKYSIFTLAIGTVLWIVLFAYIFSLLRKNIYANTDNKSSQRSNCIALQNLPEINIIKIKFVKNLLTKKYNTILDRYTETISKETDKTEYYADEILFEDDLFSGYKLAKSLPGIFIALGILGTFSGLSSGLRNINLESSDIDILKNGITTMIHGMRGAFDTSLWGIGCSIVFSLVLIKVKPHFKKITLEMCDYLDSLFYKDKTETLLENFANVNLSVLVAEVNDVTGLPENMKITLGEAASKLLNNSNHQTHSLSNFSTDVSEAIKNLSEEILKDNQATMQEQFEQLIIPIFERLERGIEALVQEKQSSATEFVEQFVTELKSALVEITENLKDSITGDTKAELEQLAHILAETGATMKGLPDELGKSTTSMSNMAENLLESSKISTASFIEYFTTDLKTVLDDIVINLKQAITEEVKVELENLAHMLIKSGESMDQFPDKLKKSTESMGHMANNLTEVSLEILENVDKAMTPYKETINESTQQLTRILEINDVTQSISKLLLKSAEELGDTRKAFSNDYSILKEQTEKLGIEASLSLKSVDTASASIKSSVNSFSEVGDQINVVFENVTSNIDGYSQTVSKSLNGFLGEYANSLNSFAKRMTSAVNNIEDLGEDLAESARIITQDEKIRA